MLDESPRECELILKKLEQETGGKDSSAWNSRMNETDLHARTKSFCYKNQS